jgi:hypothetical protein
MRSLIVALLALAFTFASARATPAQCTLHEGDHVVLFSTTDDPHVLVWDSRFRLREYYAASFDEARQLGNHAVLAEPGTRAIIDGCVPGFVQQRLLDAPADAVGVIIVTGPHRGQRGWVIGSDVRPAYRRNSPP